MIEGPVIPPLGMPPEAYADGPFMELHRRQSDRVGALRRVVRLVLERRIGRHLDRGRDSVSLQHVARRVRPRDDQIHPRADEARQRGIEPVQRSGIDGIGDDPLAATVRGPRTPQEQPEQRGAPILLERAALDQQQQIVPTGQPPDRRTEQMRHLLHDKVRDDADDRIRSRRIGTHHRDTGVRAEDGAHVRDDGEDADLGTRVVGAAIAKKENAHRPKSRSS